MRVLVPVIYIFLVFTLVLTTCSNRQTFVDSRLYFGLQTDSGSVSVQSFQLFVDSVITPRFPDGLTCYNADGQWKNRDGVVLREKTVVVEIIHPASADAVKKIEDIRAVYKKKFNQESVLWVRCPSVVDF